MVALPQRSVPTRADTLIFEIKAAILRGLCFAREALAPGRVKHHRPANALVDGPVLARISSPLWNNFTGTKDRLLTSGKVQNLRVALKSFDGIEVPAGQTLSFWKQVGKATRRRGFVAGRELREGCLIASVGGGLCQLSNALYEAALAADCEIVERHAHSRVVPGSRAQLGRDATVFWNYVDLRIRSARPFRIEAHMDRDQLEIVFRGFGDAETGQHEPATGAGVLPAAHDCTQCGRQECHLNNPDKPLRDDFPAAWLVDGCQPEFATLFASLARQDDALFLPTRRFGAGRYAWPSGLVGNETAATSTALRRSLDLRGASQGGALQARAMRADARLAAAYAAKLSHLHTHLFIAQNLLPHLWQSGALKGRSFDVLMERLPLDVLQARLDDAAARHTDSSTLADFRAPAAFVAAERAALQAADRLFTAHRDIAKLAYWRTVLLDWAPAQPLPQQRGGRTVLFPASALGRKGAYGLREAIGGLDIDLVVKGSATESADFWQDLPARRLGEDETLDRLAAVVLPALIEHQPRILLAALAAGIPVIATPACGLPAQPGLTLVVEDDAVSLRSALEVALGARASSPLYDECDLLRDDC